MYKNNKGITLLVLIITIIVLLILAAIAVNQITDDNGLIKIAQSAKNKVEAEMENKNLILNSIWDPDPEPIPDGDDEIIIENSHTHQWKWNVSKEATCTEEGIEIEQCIITGCNATRETRPISKKKHTPLVDKAVAPTCTEKGKTEGSHCSVCKEVLVAQTPVDALGHDFGDWDTTIEPTETTAGEKRRDCKRCDFYETEPIDKLTHTCIYNKEVVDEKYLASTATCTESAKYYKSCTCGKHGTETFTYGEPLGHKWDGTTQYEEIDDYQHIVVNGKCTVCEAKNESEPISHNYVTITLLEGGTKCPSCGSDLDEEGWCTNEGHCFYKYRNTRKCMDCEHTCVHDATYELLNKDEDGDYFCDACGQHSHCCHEEWTSYGVTCNKPGVKTSTCAICGAVKEETTYVGIYNGVEFEAIEGTEHRGEVEEDGKISYGVYNNYKHAIIGTCSVCGATEVASSTENHDYDEMGRCTTETVYYQAWDTKKEHGETIKCEYDCDHYSYGGEDVSIEDSQDKGYYAANEEHGIYDNGAISCSICGRAHFTEAFYESLNANSSSGTEASWSVYTTETCSCGQHQNTIYKSTTPGVYAMDMHSCDLDIYWGWVGSID